MMMMMIGICTTFVVQLIVLQQQMRFIDSFSVNIRSNPPLSTSTGSPSKRTGGSYCYATAPSSSNTPPWRSRSNAYYDHSIFPKYRMVGNNSKARGGLMRSPFAFPHNRSSLNQKNVSPVVVHMIGMAASSLVEKKRTSGVLPSRNISSTRRLVPPALFLGKNTRNEGNPDQQVKRRLQLKTLARISIPSIAAGLVATVAFPFLALTLATLMNDAGVFAVLSQDSSQFVQNFLTVAGLLFSILVGQTYYFMYIQQEAVYYSLFNEVTEAKSLLEQVALVCQGRSMYIPMLQFVQKYVEEDLMQIHKDPAVLLSARPIDDPLESIMYMTSVGVPSIVYETVRSLRQARAARLGALQRKLPKVHMWLLWILAVIELMSFPLLGAGTQTIGGYRILTVEGCLFGVLTFGVVMTLRIVGELWRPAGGAYNVDGVLRVMVRGLEEELSARMSGSKTYAATLQFPLPQFIDSSSTATNPSSNSIIPKTITKKQWAS